MNIYEKLLAIQQKLRVPKDLDNTYGNYKYRSAEKIFEAVKPFCDETKAVLFVTDDVVQIGEKLFVKATAQLIDVEMQGETYGVAVTSFAEIPVSRKGMDASQVSGASSSYARKYALNGLFAIDDNKDADVPPALPDKREDFEAYADKVYGKKEREQAIKENEAKLNANEKWRLVGKTAEIKCDDGKFYPLTMFNVGQLKAVLSKEEFADIKYIVQTELDKRQAE